jgi:hypothetical protein
MLDYIYNKKFPKPNEYFSYFCPITKIPFYYNYPTKYNIPFLSMEYLGPIIFQILSPKIIIDLLFKVLTEQSIIFVCDNIQNLTALV